MKKYIYIIFSIFLWITSLNVLAEDCSVITYYSITKWVDQTEIFDQEFSSTHNFINSIGLGMTFNVFGTRDWGNKGSYNQFQGIEEVVINSSKDNKKVNYFMIEFSEEIYIRTIDLDILAQNSQGDSFKKKIYKNAYATEYTTGKDYVVGEFLFEVEDSVTEIKIEDKCKSILIWYENIEDIDEFIFNGFNIKNYQMLKHSGWTTEYIEGAETSVTTICENSGDYSLNGTTYWVKEAISHFSPSLSVMNYTPMLLNGSYYVNYDLGKINSITPYATPNLLKNEAPYGNKIEGFYNQWISYGQGGISFPYIQVSSNTGIVYDVSPAYWTYSYSGAYYSVSSDPAWCNDVLGSYRTPCYKYGGHTNNTRGNVYSVTGKFYENVTAPSDQVIDKVEYVVVNVNTGEKEVVATIKNDEPYVFTLNNSGIWQLESRVYDKAGNMGVTTSNKFYIDNDLPIASFTPNSQDSQESIEVDISLSDQYSGIKKWQYALNHGDGYEEYSNFIYSDEPYHLVIQESGYTTIKVRAIDNAGNESVSESGVYLVDRQEVEVSTMISAVYEKGVENVLYVKLESKNKDSVEKTKVIVYLDDMQIYNQETNDESLVIPYVSDKDNMHLRVDVHNKTSIKTMSLNVVAKSKTYLEGYDLSFISPVMFVANNDGQKAYQEELFVSLKCDKEETFIGDGLNTYVDISYYNECSEINDWTCVPSNNLSQIGTSTMRFDNATSVIDGIYKIDEKYDVDLEFNGDYVLPNFYAGKKLGEIYLYPEDCIGDEVIDAGRKWYSDKFAEEGEYLIENWGNHVAINKFSWKSQKTYLLKGTIDEQYRMRFIDPNNPWPNGLSNIWDEFDEWILSHR